MEKEAMKIQRTFQRYLKRVTAWIFLLGTLFVLSISYITLRKLVFGSAHYGRFKEKIFERQTYLARAHDAQLVTYPSKDGVELVGFLVKRKQAKFNLLLCHGFKAHKESLFRLVDSFHEANILLFDFRAHGQSSGKITTIGHHEYQDVIASARYLKNHVDGDSNLPLIVLGLSMGGAAALKAAALEPKLCDGLIIDSTYASLYQVVQKTFSKYSGLPSFPFLPVMEMFLEWIAGCRLRSMKPVEFVQQIRKPLFFVHSCMDTHTSPQDSVDMYQAARQCQAKKLWLGPVAEHSCLHREYKELYKNKVMSFINDVVFKNIPQV